MFAPTEELRSFHEFVGRKLAENGPAPLSLDEAIALWQLEHQTPEEEAESLVAIRQGFDDMYAGRTRPFDEFDREFRERHGLPPQG